MNEQLELFRSTPIKKKKGKKKTVRKYKCVKCRVLFIKNPTITELGYWCPNHAEIGIMKK